MSERLYRVLLERETELVNDLHRQLVNSTHHHYKDLSWEVLLRRIETLVAYFLMSLRESPDLFVDYVAEAATDRFNEGFHLTEPLMAMRILEEMAWAIVVEKMPPVDRISALARVTSTIGAAKDRLAVAYVEHATQYRNSEAVSGVHVDVEASER